MSHTGLGSLHTCFHSTSLDNKDVLILFQSICCATQENQGHESNLKFSNIVSDVGMRFLAVKPSNMFSFSSFMKRCWFMTVYL